MIYEAALKSHYQSVSERLWPRPRPVRSLVAREVWPSQPEPAPYDHCEPSAAVLEPAKLSWRDIALEVSRKHSIPVDDILSKSRLFMVVAARQELYHRIHTECRLSYAAVGRLLNGLDHTTIRHGCHKHVERAGTPPEIMALRQGSFWTDERKARALGMYWDGKTNQEIADAVGSTRKRVAEMLSRHNLRRILVAKERMRRKVAYAGAEMGA